MISQTKEIFTNTNSKDYETKYSVRDYGICLCLLKKLIERMIALTLREMEALYFKLLHLTFNVAFYL